MLVGQVLTLKKGAEHGAPPLAAIMADRSSVALTAQMELELEEAKEVHLQLEEDMVNLLHKAQMQVLELFFKCYSNNPFAAEKAVRGYESTGRRPLEEHGARRGAPDASGTGQSS